MESLEYYNLAVVEYNRGKDKATAKLYGDAKECFEKAMEFYIGALSRKEIVNS